ncbi:hypothetical protein [Nocardia paucivorans]|uniref:hypothetical protein n=1 Tax=Nocardia paucivorans TaxID=114259 RepID=UPI0002DA7657|nr:hypothetical protein [Nocardia paucivorans]
MRRLSVVDEIFLRTHRGMGTPIALQGLWRTVDRVDPLLLERVHEALRFGPLGRRVVRSRVPGARPHWQRCIRAHPLDHTDAPIPAADLLGWADTRGDDLDPEQGPGWRLSAAAVDDGGFVVALTCSHVLADARGLILAVAAALEASALSGGGNVGADGSDRRWGAERCGDHGVSDWADARRQWSVVVGGTVSALSGGLARLFRISGSDLCADADIDKSLRGRPTAITGRSVPEGPPISGSSGPVGAPVGSVDRGEAAISGGSAGISAGAERDPVVEAPIRPSSGVGQWGGPARTAALPVTGVVVRCPVRRWDRVAAEHGGSANSLFVWFVAHTLWASGFPERGINVSLPVDTRSEPHIDNDLAMTGITVEPADGPAEILAKCRLAYRRRVSSPGGLPEEILQVVPDRLAHLMSRGAGERDILCSNIGPLPSRLLTLGPYPCAGVATRAIHPGLTVARRPRTRLSGYLCRTPDEYGLTLTGLDPDRIPTDSALRALAEHTATELGVPVTFW